MSSITSKEFNLDLESIENKYKSIKILKKYLLSNENIKRIAIQYSKSSLSHAPMISSYLSISERFIFHLGETSYGDCCVDESTASHLRPDIIIRVGESCFIKPKTLKVFFLLESKEISTSILDGIIISINQMISENSQVNRFFLMIKQDFREYIESISQGLIANNEKKLYFPVDVNEELTQNDVEDKYITIGNTKFDISTENQKKDYELSIKNDMIICFNLNNNFQNEAFSYEILMKSSVNSSLSILSIDEKAEKVSFSYMKNEIISENELNRLYMKRYNLSYKAREMKCFGIIVGNLNYNNLDKVLYYIKALLRKKNKKYYVLLLGKITDEKLSNYIEYIDCFILIACTCNSFIERKALMKPIINPIDLLFAFEVKTWSVEYSFNPDFFLEFMKNYYENQEICIDLKEANEKVKSEALSVISDENKALSLVFSSSIIQHYQNRKFKGLEIKSDSNFGMKVYKGKKGLPIKYELIDDEKINNCIEK